MKILIVDDHPLILHALEQVLPQLDRRLEVFGATDRAETLTLLARHPDCALVLLDLTLPGARGLDLLAELRRDRPLLPIVVLSATHDSATVGAAIAAGARGFVAKTASPLALLDAIETVLRGGRHVTTDLRAAPRTINGVSVDMLGLTQRQSDVLQLLIQGKPNKLICRDLRLSEGTVKVHVSAILKALNVHSRSQAIVELTRRGISVDNRRRRLTRPTTLEAVDRVSPRRHRSSIARARPRRPGRRALCGLAPHVAVDAARRGAAVLGDVGTGAAVADGLWVALIVANQLWRGMLVRAWHRAQPGFAAAPRWGRYWAVGSTLGGALWGVAAVAMYPDSPPHQALLIVCLFGVVFGGLNLTAVYKPSFYGFVLPALVPLILREALVADQVHTFTAVVMSVVLGFVLAFGHHLNDLLTRSLAIRYENIDLIDGLKRQTRAAHEARAAAEAANRAKSQLLAAASHDLRQPLHALGLYTAALAARARDATWRPLVGNVQNAVNALETQFAQLLDLSRLEAGALTPERSRVALAPLFARVAARIRAAGGGQGARAALRTHTPRRRQRRRAARAHGAQPGRQRGALHRAAAS